MNEDDESRRYNRNNNNGSPLNQCYESTTEELRSGEYPREPSASSNDKSIRTSVCNFVQTCCSCCFPCFKSSHEEGDEEEIHPVLRALAIGFSRRPFIVLLITYVLAFSITWIGLSEYGLPEIDDPYLGFETRSTSISNRIITLRNLKNEINQLQTLENYPGEKLSGREWRRRRRRRQSFTANVGLGVGDEDEEKEDGFGFHNRDLCPASPLEDYSRVALELKDPSKIFEYESIMLICFFQKKMEDLSSYKVLCEKDSGYGCCPSWSLPNYITSYSNKSDCAQLQKIDVQNFVRDLFTCQNFYKNESKSENKIPGINVSIPGGDCWKGDSVNGSCPRMCLHGGILHNTYADTLDNRFLLRNESRYTMVVPPVAKSSSTNDHPALEYLPEEIREIVLPKDEIILAGYDFGGKDNTFKMYLVSDLQFMITASVLIFIVVCLYTKSIFVTVVSFGILTLSLGNAYFIYSAILKIPYFPFMNMLVTIIVMGIGTDGTLILGSQWHLLRIKYASQKGEKMYWEILTTELLKETTCPLFITTCTTAAAFFASLTSSITTIRCFSIFAGTATLMGFILLYFSVPPALILSELVSNYLISLFPGSETESKGKLFTKVSQLYQRFHQLRRASLIVFTKPYHYLKRTIFENHRAKCWLIAFLLLVALLMWSTFIVFVSPTFQLPNTEQFQLLSSDHPIEKFDRVVEPNFVSEGVPEEEMGDKMTVYFMWGLQSVDTGNTLDPMDDGTLQFDEEFSMEQTENQKWMLRLCEKLKLQPFYDDVANSMVGAHYDSCFLDTMITWMKRDCEHIFFKNVSYAPCCKMSKFPYEPEVFSKCVGLASRDMHRTPSLYFRSDVAGPKFFISKENAYKPYRGFGRQTKDNGTEKTGSITDENDPNSKRAGQLATFSLRVKTNVTFSLAYEKMDKFYKDVETFFYQYHDSDKVPVGLENGFFVSAHLDFYDLQTSLLLDTVQSVLLSAGLCFLFLWIFIGKLGVALGAVLCIFAIVIVSSAILITAFSWKLGVFESIAVTVAIGLSDFTAHNSIEFSKRHSVAGTTSPTFFAAVTTTIMGLTMLLCSNVLVYQQIGAFFTVLIVTSWTYSVFFLSPVLTFLDFVTVAIQLRRLPMPPSSIYARSDGVSSPSISLRPNNHDPNASEEATVYCNAMLTSGPRKKKGGLQRKNRAISEPTMQHARNSVHFGRAESTELVDSPRTMGRSIRTISGGGAQSQANMMEQWKLLKKLGTETAV